MWLVKFIPDWFFYLLVFGGVAALILAKFIPGYYRTPAQTAAALALVVGLFMSGASYNDGIWTAKVKELELEYQKSQVVSEKATTEVVTKFITKREIVKQQGEEVVRYIDREIVKYNEVCKLAPEVIQAHNQAAQLGAKK